MKKETSIAKLMERFTKAASMQRWNDHIRPVEFTELDKQAHKMVITYILAKSEEERRKEYLESSERDFKALPVDWNYLVEGGIFEFLHRLILTDIKPPVFHKMIEDTETKELLNQHVFSELEGDMKGLNRGFYRRFQDYFENPENNVERRILRAAHYLATNWEFKIIYHTAPFIYGIEETKQNIENQIEDHYDLIGVQKLLLGKRSFGFVDLCGQLRFQKRWAHSPRVPETSVLGHMLIVAITSYFCTMEMDVKACKGRFYNNYFGGLFHDLPEVLTKDIISPIKRVDKEVDKRIREYEHEKMEEKLLPLLPKPWRREMRYLTGTGFGGEDLTEFKNRIIVNGKVRTVKTIEDEYNEDRYFPLDGEMLDVCDKISAYLEAILSMKYGITSESLIQGKDKILEDYRSIKINGINFGGIFDYFNGRLG
jgi:putative hydrolases of HD superfamily